jgi:hypothetical protein
VYFVEYLLVLRTEMDPLGFRRWGINVTREVGEEDIEKTCRCDSE